MTRTEAIQKIRTNPILRSRIASAAARWRSVDPARVARGLVFEWLVPAYEVRRPIDVIAIEAITRRALVAAVAAGEMPGSYLLAAPHLAAAMPTAQQVKDAGVGIWHDTSGSSGYFLSADPLSCPYEGSYWEIQLFRDCEDTVEVASMPIERGLAKRILAIAIADGIADKYAIDLARRV